MNTSHERVLCFPRSLVDRIGIFQGFRADDGSLVNDILTSGEVRFVERSKAENDPAFKQLIPYVLISHRDRFLYYVRGQSSGEARLRSLGSLGIGGHISVTDRGLFTTDMLDVFWDGLRREVAEEIEVKSEYTQRTVGLINDDSNPVGMVHFGVLVKWELAEAAVAKRERSITSMGFKALPELVGLRDEMETWSRIVLDSWLQTTRY